MATELRALAPHDRLASVVDAVLAGFQQDFPVVDAAGRPIGVLTRGDLLRALAARGPDAPVADIMHREYVTADDRELLATALGRLEGCGCHSMPVTRQGRLAGMLTMDNLGEYLLVQNAMRSRRAA